MRHTARTPNLVSILRQSATRSNQPETLEAIITDPPYYDAIPYADLSDFFLRLASSNDWQSSFLVIIYAEPLTPKINVELVQHSLHVLRAIKMKPLESFTKKAWLTVSDPRLPDFTL